MVGEPPHCRDQRMILDDRMGHQSRRPPIAVMSKLYVYRVLRCAEWEEMLASDQFSGNAVDERDGFIHLSTREQVPGTIAAYFANVASDLIILEIDAASLRGELRWETSRGGALFPHLYGVVPVGAVMRTMTADQFTLQPNG